VAHKPWRSHEAETALVGKPASAETFAKAAELVVAGARTYEHNAFKVELAKQCVVKALTQAAQGVQA
jgi:xanthine dehydrogenase YagS FAD-binding subunit